MRVLVTGSSGFVGRAATAQLLALGHDVRLLTRRPARDAAWWAETPWVERVRWHEGDLTAPHTLAGAADGCDAVLHTAAAGPRSPHAAPAHDLGRVNVDGTRHLVAEAERSGARRFVHVSSLAVAALRDGVPGEAQTHPGPPIEPAVAAYLATLRAGEAAARAFRGRWTVCRPGEVYGPADGGLSLAFTVVRAVAVVPRQPWDDAPFAPLALDDLALALARVLERDDLAGETLALVGPDTTSRADLLRRLGRLTERRVWRVPAWLLGTGRGFGTGLARRIMDAAGHVLGVEPPPASMRFRAHAAVPALPVGVPNALTERLGIRGTPLDRGLADLADLLPEQLPPASATGRASPLSRHRHWADVRDSQQDADALFAHLCRHFAALAPPALLRVGAEPAAAGRPTARAVVEGATLTLGLPLRGNVQVRVEAVAERQATCLTLRGHLLAGTICFRVRGGAATRRGGTSLRVEVRSYDAPAHVGDRVAMALGGAWLQRLTWARLLRAVAAASGGRCDGPIRHETVRLGARTRARFVRWAAALAERRWARAYATHFAARSVGNGGSALGQRPLRRLAEGQQRPRQEGADGGGIPDAVDR